MDAKDLACAKVLTILSLAGRCKQAGTESLPIKVGHREILPHLETTCTRLNTSARRSTRPSAGPERSHLLQILPSFTVRQFFSVSSYLFLLRQHWQTPSWCVENVGKWVRLLALDGRNAELAQGLPSNPILSGPCRTAMIIKLVGLQLLLLNICSTFSPDLKLT